MLTPRFTNRIILDTGASSGFGLAMTRAFLAEGATVVMVARNPDRLAKAATDMQRLAPGKILTLSCDVTHRPNVNDAVTKTIAQFGRVDILVNNAGTGLIAPVEHIQADDALALFQTNFFGAFHFTQAILPHMQRQRTGHIINMASVAGLRGIPNSSIYCASKAALIAFSDSLRIELRDHGIHVSVICPSRTDDTPFVARAKKYGLITLYKVPPGLTTDMVVRTTLDAIVHRRRLVILPFHARLLHFMNKFFPRAVDNYLHQKMPSLDGDPIS